MNISIAALDVAVGDGYCPIPTPELWSLRGDIAPQNTVCQRYVAVYVYSTDSLKANNRLGFSYVGGNSGNYIRVQSGANGRIFEWVAPQDGILQGNYEPVKLLITPKKKQMMSFGGETIIKERNKINFEAALTNNDLNSFSQKGDNDNIGYAFKIGLERNLLKNDTGITYLNIGANYMFTDKYFDALEPYRNPEFVRDWNLSFS